MAAYLKAEVIFEDEQEARHAIKELSSSIGPTLGRFNLAKFKSSTEWAYKVSVECTNPEVARSCQGFLKGWLARTRYDHV